VVHFVNPVADYQGTSGLLYTEWFSNPPMGEWFWITLILIFQLYCILLIFLQLKVSSESTLIPGLVFVLCATLIPEVGNCQPVIFANTMLLVAVQQLFSISPRSSSGKEIFNTGVFLALATMFYGSYMMFLVGAVSGINIIRSWRFREIKVLFLGYVTPFFLIGVYYFWFDKFGYFVSSIFDGVGIISFRYFNDYWHIGVIAIVGLLLLSAILNVGQVMNKKTNIKQNYFKISYWFLFSCFLVTLIQKQIGIEHVIVLTIPLSFILSEYLINWKEIRAFFTN